MQKVIQTKPSEGAALIINKVENTKKAAYGISKTTIKKLERIEENKLWEKRASELEDFILKAKDQPGRDMHKLFKREIDQYTLKYNEDLLSKKDPPGEWKD